MTHLRAAFVAGGEGAEDSLENPATDAHGPGAPNHGRWSVQPFAQEEDFLQGDWLG